MPPGRGATASVGSTEARTVAGSGADECAVGDSRASNTDPVRKSIDDGETGRLAGFFDAERFALGALEVLRDPTAHRAVADRAAAMTAFICECWQRASTSDPRCSLQRRGSYVSYPVLPLSR